MKRSYSLWYFILFFTAIFPIAYIIYKDSNVYGGWRHVLFIFPSLAVISALGVNKLISSFKQTYLQYIVMALFGLLTVLPIRHIIVNHPHEYIYYNTLVGGVKKAYGKYEMDYFYHSLKAASEWLIENKIEKANPGDGEKIIVASNFITPLKYYFRNYMDKVKLVYIRYYERGNTNWDYAVIANSYIDPYQMKKKTWPPSNTIKTIDVDGKPINAILERKDKSEFTGYTMLTGGNAEASIPFFKAAISKDRNYEMVYYNLAQAYLNTGQFDRALEAVSKSLKLYPTYDRALNLLGMIYLNKREYNNALQVFRKNMDLNPKYFLSVYYIGVLYAQSGDYNTALKYLEKTLDKSPRYKPAYILIAQILDLQGKKDLAKEYLNYANSLP
jgi:tetratricopeptide (TPR) repeat protein